MSSVDEINEVINNLRPPPARFSLKQITSWNGQEAIHLDLEASPLNVPEAGNFWSELIIKEHYAHVQVYGKKYEVNHEGIYNSLRDETRYYLRVFLRNNKSTDEKFELSDIGKWYSNYAFANGWKRYEDVLFNIYKYMKQNDVKLDTSQENVHAKNALAMLRFIFERDFKKEHIKRQKKRG